MITRLALFLLLFGCGHSIDALDRSSPLGSLRDELPPLEEVPVHGYTVAVKYVERGESRTIEGELLEVDEQWFVVLTEDEGVVRIARRALEKVEVELHPSGAGWIAGWWVLGALISPSHGWFGVISLPLWLLTGIPCTVTSAVGNDLTVPLHQIDALSQFARFPTDVEIELEADLTEKPPEEPKPAAIEQALPEGLVQITALRSELNQCTNGAVRLRLAIEIAPSGWIKTIEVLESSGNRGTDSCVIRTLKTRRYPGPATHEVELRLPW